MISWYTEGETASAQYALDCMKKPLDIKNFPGGGPRPLNNNLFLSNFKMPRRLLGEYWSKLLIQYLSFFPSWAVNITFTAEGRNTWWVLPQTPDKWPKPFMFSGTVIWAQVWKARETYKAREDQ